MQLRRSDIAAARDYFYIIEGLHELEKVGGDKGILHGMKKMFSNHRNRFAVISSFTVMVLQQLCGVNILTFYSESHHLCPNLVDLDLQSDRFSCKGDSTMSLL
jgi:hypothetical protein